MEEGRGKVGVGMFMTCNVLIHLFLVHTFEGIILGSHISEVLEYLLHYPVNTQCLFTFSRMG
jgi:hypothetical protein